MSGECNDGLCQQVDARVRSLFRQAGARSVTTRLLPLAVRRNRWARTWRPAMRYQDLYARRYRSGATPVLVWYWHVEPSLGTPAGVYAGVGALAPGVPSTCHNELARAVNHGQS